MSNEKTMYNSCRRFFIKSDAPICANGKYRPSIGIKFNCIITRGLRFDHRYNKEPVKFLVMIGYNAYVVPNKYPGIGCVIKRQMIQNIIPNKESAVRLPLPAGNGFFSYPLLCTYIVNSKNNELN